MVTIQKILKEVDDEVAVAVKYYSFLFALNNKHLPKRELELFAFTASRGNIESKSARIEFVTRFGTTEAMMGNLKTELVKKGLLIKKNRKCKIPPSLVIDFKEDLIIQITLKKTVKEEVE